MKVVSGTVHQGNWRFGRFAGMQCTAMAFSALKFSFLGHIPVQHWNSDIIDDILSQGNLLYSHIIGCGPNSVPRYLLHRELPEDVSFNSDVIHSIFYFDMFYGTISNGLHHLDDTSSLMTPFATSLQHGFQISDYIILTISQQTVSLFTSNNVFFVFDSHSRSSSGKASPSGTAVLIEFENVLQLQEYICDNYLGLNYELTPVIFETMHSSSDKSKNYQPNPIDISNTPANSDDGTQESCKGLLNNIGEFNGISIADKLRDPKRMNTSNVISPKKLRKKNKIRSKSNTNNVCSKPSTDHTYCLQQNEPHSPEFHSKNFPQSVAAYEEILSNHSTIANTKGLIDVPEKKIPLKNKRLFSNGLAAQCPSQDHTYSIKSSRIAQDTMKQKEKFTACEHKYLTDIREIPSKKCSSCMKFLFPSQTVKLHTETSFTKSANLILGCDLCTLCLKEFSNSQFPKRCEKINSLDVETVPQELSCLDPLERRFISKLHTFMTLLVLPRGGQFAEKGMAIHFAAPLQEIINTFPNIKLVSQFVPVFQRDTNLFAGHYVNIEKIIRALKVLKNINHLYNNVEIKEPNVLENWSEKQVDFDEINEMATVSLDYTVPSANVESFIQDGSLVLPNLNTDPVYIHKIPFGEEMAFPHLFPTGKHGVLYPRLKKLTMKQYFQQRLYHSDSRWRKDISYLMNAVNIVEQEQLLSSVNIAMKCRKSVSDGKSLKNSDLNDLVSNPDISENSYMFTKNIRGTAGYWKNTLVNLLAMFKCLGPPTIFLTLSANDSHWIELAMSYTGLSYEDISNADINMQQYIRSDPLIAAIHFERRWKSLLKHILKEKKTLGHIEDYFARVEFQNRGSAHLHAFVWLRDAPDLQLESHENIISFIDSIISTQLPSSESDPNLYELVKTLQTHNHTFTCKSRPPKSCRFGFPFKQLSNTKIVNNIDITHSKGRFYETARDSNSIYINAYNPTILQLWQANMDIQLVGGSTAAAYYVCSYLCKTEPDDLKQALSDLMHAFQKTNLCQRTRLLKLGACVLKNRKLSAQEAAYRLGSLQLVHSSRHVLFINCRAQHKRIRILKSKQQRENLNDDSENIFNTGIIDHYHRRPFGLETWTLFAFASWFRIISVTDKTETHNVLLSPFDDLAVKQRPRPYVIRTPYFQLDSDEYYYSLLLLHLPHREESHLTKLENYNVSPKEAFEHKHSMLDTSRVAFNWHTSDLERLIIRIRMSQDELAKSINLHSHEYEEITDTRTSSQHEFNFMSADHIDSSDLNVIDHDRNHADIQTETVWHNLAISDITEEELLHKISHLNNDQVKVFKAVKKHFQIVKSGSQSDDSNPLRIFITGGAGVGKTYLLKVICEWMKLSTFKRPGTNPVILAAPTGVAAKNINGHTLHSLLSLPVQHGYEPSYQTVSPSTLQKLRRRFVNVHTLIIDEISMVSSNVFSFIDRRLREILDVSSASFGGMNIIVLGDFYQLRPVRGKFPFVNPLWLEFVPYFLNTNVRQIADPRYAELLNRARVAELTTEDIELLKTRLISAQNKEMLHIYPVNKLVADFNQQQQRSLPQINAITIIAIDKFSTFDVDSGDAVPPEFVPSDDRDAGGLPLVLSICVASRVMLLRNIFTECGLVNSAIGHVETIELNDNYEAEMIYVKFNDHTIGRVLQRTDFNNSIPIQRYVQTYHFKGRSITRNQFPLSLSWACTVHKIQGLSLPEAVLSIGEEIFEPGQAYVALSRIQTLAGLHLLSFSPQRIKANPRVIEEYKRLQQKETLTQTA